MTEQPKNKSKAKRNRRKFKPAVAQWRLDLVKLVVLCTAFALIVYDAWVSYQGFKRLDVGDHAPIVFCFLIFASQLAVGVLHALGDDFTDVMADSQTAWGNLVWKGVLVTLYLVDIMSNAVEFGFFDRWSSPLGDPVEAFGGGLLILGMAWGLTFADETLLRLYDRVQLAAAKNYIFAKRYRQNIAQHQRYLKSANQVGLDRAETQGQYEGGQWEFGEQL